MTEGGRGGEGTRPLACVTTPVYNGAAHLMDACFKSVRAQTYRPLIHVIVDNASTDATPELIARYAAEVDYPVKVVRNPETVRQPENFNVAAASVPEDAAYFTVLCADDMMAPTAIEDMMALAATRDDLVMIGARESVNDSLRPAYMPEGVSIFDASNMCARILEDDARAPFPHVLVRRDVLRAGEKAFREDYVGHDAEFVIRILAQGGSFGFVHKRLFNNLHHTGTVTFATSKKVPYLWERFVDIERFGPSVFSNTAYRRVRRRHLLVVYRRFLFWFFTGAHENLKRDLPRFRARGAAPSLWDYVNAVLSWPAHRMELSWTKPHEAFAWAQDAYRREAPDSGRPPAPAEPADIKRA